MLLRAAHAAALLGAESAAGEPRRRGRGPGARGLGAVGGVVLAWLQLFLVGDERYRALLTRAGARAGVRVAGAGGLETNLLALDAALGEPNATATAAAALDSTFAYPPLVEMVRKFKETGVAGETAPVIVDGTCATLSVDTAGLSLSEKAQRDVSYRAAPGRLAS